VDDDRRVHGWVPVDAVTTTALDAGPRPFAMRVRASDSLRTALDAMVRSHTGVAVRVSEGDRYEGILTQEILSREIL